MSFNYTSPLGIRLTAKEEQLLESIDKFNCPLPEFINLAALHSKIEVVLLDKANPRQFKYTVTNQQWNTTMSLLEKKVNETQRQHDKKRDEALERQRSGEDSEELWKEKWKLERLLGLCSWQKYYYENNTKQLPNGEYQIVGDNPILGEYDHTNKRVILYNDNIRQANPYNDEFRTNCIFSVVYVHEMIHAYLDKGKNVIEEIEEPIVESAMLEFFQNYDKDIYEFAKQDVEAKQFKSGLIHYGFGYYIFKNPNGTNWLKDYRYAKNSLVKTDPNVVAYLDYWKMGIYPEKKEKECLVALYKALHHGTTIPITVKQGNVRRVRRRNYTINGKGSYSMYEVVEEFVKFLQGQGNTIVTINQKIQNYINSGWIFVSSNQGKVAWSNEKGEYSSLSGFYITKQWKGNANGNFTRLKDEINQLYKNFQIVEI
jgi:hypothetical protein